MRSYPQLVLRGSSVGADRTVAIGTRHLSVGRGPDNDLVIPDPEISRHHAIVWSTDAGVFLRDLGSANGTFIDDERVHDTVTVPYGAEVRLGKGTRLSVRPPETPAAAGSSRSLALEDVAAGVRHPLHTDRFVIGGASSADLRVTGGQVEPVTLIVYPNGEVWLGQEEDDQALEIGADFEVGGTTFRIVDVDPTRQPTVQPENERYQYRLKVGLDGPGGAVAEISHLQTSLTHSINAENRVVLMYLLARKILEDREAGLPAADQGWCDDEDVIVGVWGRTALGSGANRLKVLVHRVRKELKADGFEPWCIEKRSGLIRGRFIEVEVS